MSQTFAPWGDTNSYFPVAGGAFEGTKASWVLNSKAALSAGNEPWKVRAATDTQSLTLNGSAVNGSGGGLAKSPSFCLDSTMPYIRFFARQSVRGGSLSVKLVLQGGTTMAGSNSIQVVDLADGSMPSWAPTGQLPLSSALTIPAGSSVQASLHFQTQSTTGSWQIDDVYVDPFRNG